MKPSNFRTWVAVLALGVWLAYVGSATGGRVGGPTTFTRAVGPYQSATFMVPFRGGEVATVMMVGGDSTELELNLFDGNWALEIGDGDGNRQVAQMYVLRGGFFEIIVRNLGPLPNAFILYTN